MDYFKYHISTGCLKAPHQRATDFITYSSAGLALILLLAFAIPLSDFLNTPDKCINCQNDGFTWAIIFFAAFFIFYYFCHAAIATVYSVNLLVKNNLTFKECIMYVLFQKFPKKWFKNNS